MFLDLSSQVNLTYYFAQTSNLSPAIFFAKLCLITIDNDPSVPHNNFSGLVLLSLESIEYVQRTPIKREKCENVRWSIVDENEIVRPVICGYHPYGCLAAA